ncbi:MAG: ATP-binding cassette domain-containing protein [Actinobacteria bacterium]|nr:ATP-binding cassette domain-containing protein [Actinomycetota bacterium]
MVEPYLALKNIEHSSNESGFKLKVDNLSFIQGEKIAILGRNGAGKSTLARLIAFIEKPRRGEIYYRGKIVNSSHQATLLRKKFSFLVQRPVCFSGTVSKNLEIAALLKGIEKKEVSKVIDAFDISSFLLRNSDQLSTGEARRVQLAMAFLGNPESIVLDEATSFLDEEQRLLLVERISDLILDEQNIFFVTHRLDEAIRLGRRLVVLENGNIIYDGSFENLSLKRTNELPLILQGISVVSGRVIEVNGRFVRVRASEEIISGHANDSVKVGDRIRAVIKEDTVIISNESSNLSSQNLYRALVSEISEVAGEEGFFRVTFSKPFPFAAIVTGESLLKQRIEAGKWVYASFKASSVLVYKTV